MGNSKESILSDLYRQFESSVEVRKYKRAFRLFIKSLKYSLFYFVKTIFNRRSRYFNFIKEILYRFRYRLPMIYRQKSQKNVVPVVISLTSYPARFSTLHICLKSLLQQSLRPTKVVLYLDNYVHLREVPRKVRRLQKFGLEIRPVGENLKPHTKYYYAMHDFSCDALITVDDDQIYPKDMLYSLYNSYLKYPHCISARRVMKIVRDENGIAMPSNSWIGECSSILSPSMDLLAQGVGGVLYPPSIFDLSSSCFDKECIRNNCHNADDMWLKFIEVKEGVPVVWCPNKLIFHAIHYENRLMNTNVLEGENDNQIIKCEKVFGFKL